MCKYRYYFFRRCSHFKKVYNSCEESQNKDTSEPCSDAESRTKHLVRGFCPPCKGGTNRRLEDESPTDDKFGREVSAHQRGEERSLDKRSKGFSPATRAAEAGSKVHTSKDIPGDDRKDKQYSEKDECAIESAHRTSPEKPMEWSQTQEARAGSDQESGSGPILKKTEAYNTVRMLMLDGDRLIATDSYDRTEARSVKYSITLTLVSSNRPSRSNHTTVADVFPSHTENIPGTSQIFVGRPRIVEEFQYSEFEYDRPPSYTPENPRLSRAHPQYSDFKYDKPPSYTPEDPRSRQVQTRSSSHYDRRDGKRLRFADQDLTSSRDLPRHSRDYEREQYQGQASPSGDPKGSWKKVRMLVECRYWSEDVSGSRRGPQGSWKRVEMFVECQLWSVDAGESTAKGLKSSRLAVI